MVMSRRVLLQKHWLSYWHWNSLGSLVYLGSCLKGTLCM
ncbi:hypothetical protein Golob_001147 [Gossypium lobatum]|uniref:Uncharacterized protein n=1 Tax=Gossypium lobatum TaxID=34289 RepID=A0A7J8NAE0_9ROSI|nr:hypothetical protein [Gossypium lobatum]